MIGIKAIGTYVPQGRVSNIDRMDASGKDRDFITGKIGFESVARKRAEEETSDLCVEAFKALEGACAIKRDEVDCVIVVTQNPDKAGLPHTAAVVQSKLSLNQAVAAFDVSLGCSGYVYGLAIITSFMKQMGLRSGLLFTADPYSKILDPEDWDTELLFGDAATVTWVGEDPVFSLRPAMFGSNGELGHSIEVPAPGAQLKMLGSNVFKFSMTAVPAQIGAYLQREGLTLDDIPLFLFHQGSRFIVENLARRLKLSAEKVPFEAAELGNTVSSTLPLMLEKRLSKPPRRLLMSGFGVGLSWATMIIESTVDTDGEADDS